MQQSLKQQTVLVVSSHDAVNIGYYLMGVVAFEILVDTEGGIDGMEEAIHIYRLV